MEWKCPHCSTDLVSADPGALPRAAGPAPGWAYVRCFQCSGFAMFERATGQAKKIERPSQKKAAPITARIEDAFLAEAPPVSKNRRFVPLSAFAVAASFLVLSLSATIYVARSLQPVIHLAAAPSLSSDTLHSAAMAPTRPVALAPYVPATQNLPLSVQARAGIRALELRSGPNAKFPLVGLGDPEERYDVLDWKDQWFKIALDDGSKTAWVPQNEINFFSDDSEGPR